MPPSPPTEAPPPKESLDFALGVIDEVAGLMNLRYAKNWSG